MTRVSRAGLLAALLLLSPVAMPAPSANATEPQSTSCPSGQYRNSYGQCVRRPTSARSAGATAVCADGSYSYSRTRQGTCSWHGGVLFWLSGTDVDPLKWLSPQCEAFFRLAIRTDLRSLLKLIQLTLRGTNQYRGPIDGIWGPMSQQAWTNFLLRMGFVNPGTSYEESAMLGFQTVCAFNGIP